MAAARGSAAHQWLVLMVLRTALAKKLQQLWGEAKEACCLLRRSRRPVWARCCEAILTEVRHDFANALSLLQGHHAKYLPTGCAGRMFVEEIATFC